MCIQSRNLKTVEYAWNYWRVSYIKNNFFFLVFNFQYYYIFFPKLRFLSIDRSFKLRKICVFRLLRCPYLSDFFFYNALTKFDFYRLEKSYIWKHIVNYIENLQTNSRLHSTPGYDSIYSKIRFSTPVLGLDMKN